MDNSNEFVQSLSHIFIQFAYIPLTVSFTAAFFPIIVLYKSHVQIHTKSPPHKTGYAFPEIGLHFSSGRAGISKHSSIKIPQLNQAALRLNHSIKKTGKNRGKQDKTVFSFMRE